MDRIIRKKLHIYGIVQGVGFRPHAARAAAKSGVTGTVCNMGPYVEIFVQGSDSGVRNYCEIIRSEAPARAAVLKMETEEVPPVPGESEFRIIRSEKVRGSVFVSPDIAVCPDCERELFDPADRRYLHPFINCTACGPRLTILKGMPYDRVRTSMGKFPMCPDCEREYTDPESRRYHAQPVCCPECGPRLSAFRPGDQGVRIEGDAEVIKLARETLRGGGIIAVKGIGGFHLACDARDRDIVERLRTLKARPFKPFAVMVKDMETASRECVTAGAESLLTGPEKPIMLLPKKKGGKVCDAAAPEESRLGIFLPYTPLHHLLFRYPDGKGMTDAFIMTSANPKGAPICRTAEDVEDNLSSLCDLVVDHDREILLRSDDSVASVHRGNIFLIRRSRGYSPLPFTSPFDETGTALGTGSDLKNTFCLAKDGLYYLSPYIGDMEDVRTADSFRAALGRMEELLEFSPEKVVCDLHPGYHSSEEAERQGLPVIRIQHHFAHVLSCLAEHGEEGPVIGIALDGTGYGDDGTVWGGEFLKADRRGYSRLGCLKPFLQAGGDLAAVECRRPAAGFLLQATGDAGETEELCLRLGLGDKESIRMLVRMAENGVNTVRSSSFGRFFDAASAVLGLRSISTCEGEAAMVLQYYAETAAAKNETVKMPVIPEPEYIAAGRVNGHYENPAPGLSRKGCGAAAREELTDGERSGFPGESAARTGGSACAHGEKVNESGMFYIPGAPVILELAERRLRGESVPALALAFHEAAAAMITEGAKICRRGTGLDRVVLTGGVMQNLLLLEMTRKSLEEEGFSVLTHSLVPANDGGISLGQAWYGMKCDI